MNTILKAISNHLTQHNIEHKIHDVFILIWTINHAAYTHRIQHKENTIEFTDFTKRSVVHTIIDLADPDLLLTILKIIQTPKKQHECHCQQCTNKRNNRFKLSY